MRHLTPMLFFLACCGPIAPGPVEDDEGNEVISPGAFDSYLGVRADYPAELGPRPTLRFVFDTFIDEDELLDFAVVSVASAGLVHAGRVRWQLSTRTLEFRPFSELVPGLRYKPSIDASVLFSVTGAPLGTVDLPEFVVVETAPETPAPPLPDVRWSAIDAVFAAKCHSCHSDTTWLLNPLTRESLVGRRSEQVDELLVLPFDPGDSYLLHKCVPDYPVRRFTVQPPPWSDAEPLTDAEVLLIERWIGTGARP